MAPAAAGELKTTLLRNGLLWPLVGLGTYRLTPDEVERVVPAAVAAGCELVDTAVAYRHSHGAISRALSGASTRPAWIQTKIPPGEQGYDAARACALRCIDELRGCSSRLAILTHWPGGKGLPPDSSEHAELRAGTWRALQELYLEGRVDAIGVSNFDPRHLAELERAPGITELPHVHQLELHPLLPQRAMRELCAARGIHVQAYASLGQASARLLEAEAVVAAARARTMPPAHVLLRWALQRGVSCIPRTRDPARAAENARAALDTAALTDAELAAIDALEDGTHFCWDGGTIR